jgi:hypothetical protein
VPADRFAGCKGDMSERPICALFASRAAARERETKVFLRADAPEGSLNRTILLVHRLPIDLSGFCESRPVR